MNTISFSRLKHLIRYDVVSSWRYMGVLLIVFTLLFTLVRLGVLLAYGYELKLEGASADGVSTVVAGTYMFWIGFIVLVGYQILATNFQHGSTTKQGRMQMLLLPATMAEKFIVYLLRITVGLTLVFLLALFLAEVFCMVLAPIMGLPVYGLMLFKAGWTPLHECFLFVKAMPMLSLFFATLIVNAHAFHLLCGCFFRKFTIVMSLVAEQVLSMIFSVVFSIFSIFLFDNAEIIANLYENYIAGNPSEFLGLLILLILVLTMVEYYFAYRFFTRQQLLGRTWVNV